MIKRKHVAILLVTMDNREYLEYCLRSLLANTTGVEFCIHLVNNGQPGSCGWARHPLITVHEHVGGTSWVDGLAQGAAATDAPFWLFLNDDTVILPSQPDWLARLADRMDDPKVGAVGPASNLVSGPQSILHADIPTVYYARYLISFCCLVRAEAWWTAGGFDPAMTDADDIDYSIRLRQAGYTLIGDRTVYVHHQGYVTGTRLHGDRWRKGGYNSREWAARNARLLAEKHGEQAVNEVYLLGYPAPYLYLPPTP